VADTAKLAQFPRRTTSVSCTVSTRSYPPALALPMIEC